MSNQIKSYNVWGLGPALWTHSSVQWENPGRGFQWDSLDPDLKLK